MRTTSIASMVFEQVQPPSDPAQLQRYLIELEQRISAALNSLAAGHLDITYSPPAKPRDGDFRHADGTTWNPGSGKGFYRFNGTTWIFLG